MSLYPTGPKLGHVTVVALGSGFGSRTVIVGWVHDVTECARRAADLSGPRIE
jgi:hypothetical protein